jgi:hypothetical protein
MTRWKTMAWELSDQLLASTTKQVDDWKTTGKWSVCIYVVICSLHNLDLEIVKAWQRRYSHSVNHPSKLKLTIVQKNKLKAFMSNTNNKKEYRRLLAILQKAEGRTFEGIANEHWVSTRSVLDYMNTIRPRVSIICLSYVQNGQQWQQNDKSIQESN